MKTPKTYFHFLKFICQEKIKYHERYAKIATLNYFCFKMMTSELCLHYFCHCMNLIQIPVNRHSNEMIHWKRASVVTQKSLFPCSAVYQQCLANGAFLQIYEY